MADENLSLSIQFENFQQLLAQLEAVKVSIKGISEIKVETKGLQGLSSEAQKSVAALSALGKVGGTTGVQSEPYVRLAVAARGASDAVRRAGESSKDAAKKQDQGAKSAKSFASSLLNLKTVAIGAAAAVTGINLFNVFQRAQSAVERQLKTAQQVFIETQAAILRFASGLQAVGKFSEQAVVGVQNYASAIQNATGISDDLIIQSSALIAQLGGLSGNALRRATDASIELSKVLGIDLLTAALLIAKAAQGNTTQFQRYGFVIDRNIPKHKRFAFLLDDIEKKFKGTATLAAIGLGGSIDKLSKSWDDLLKALGGTFSVVAPEIDKVTARVQGWVAQTDNQIDNVILASESTRRFADEIESLSDVMDPGIFGQFGIELQRFSRSFDEFDAIGSRGFIGGFAAAFRNLFKPDTAEEFLRFLRREFSNIEAQADIVFRSGEPKGLQEFIDSTERALRAIRRFPIDLTVEGADEVKRFLDILETRFVQLGERAREASKVRAEELIREQIDRLDEIRRRAIEPLEAHVVANFDQFHEERERAERELQRLEKTIIKVVSPKIPPSVTGILDARQKIDEVVTRLEEQGDIPVNLTAEDIKLDPREVEKLKDLRTSIELTPHLDDGQVSRFLHTLEAIAEQIEEAWAQAISESGQIVDGKALARARELIKIFDFGRKQLADFNKEQDRLIRLRNTQEFFKGLFEDTLFDQEFEIPIAPRLVVAQAEDELTKLRNTILDLFDIRGASISDVIKVEGFGQDVTKTAELVGILNRELGLLSLGFKDLSPDEARAQLQQLQRLYQSTVDAVVNLREAHGTIAPEVQAGLDAVLRLVEQWGPTLEKAAQATEEFSVTAGAILSELVAASGAAFRQWFDSLTTGAGNFADEMIEIFRVMVREILAILAKLAVGRLLFNSIFSSITGGGGILAQLLGLPAGFFGKASTQLPEAPEPLTLKPRLQLIPPEALLVRPSLELTAPKALQVKPELELLQPETLLAPRPQLVDTSPALELARIRRAEIRAASLRPQEVVVRLPEDTRRPGGDTFNFNVEAFDGASVRSQFNHGPLRSEAARASRRRRIG